MELEASFKGANLDVGRVQHERREPRALPPPIYVVEILNSGADVEKNV